MCVSVCAERLLNDDDETNRFRMKGFGAELDDPAKVRQASLSR